MTGWSVSAAFFDYDRDGWLDLFVGNYLRYTRRGRDAVLQPVRRAATTARRTRYKPLPGRLFHNNRDGTFADVTAKAASPASSARRSACATADFNGDGWIDLYVANDGQPNQLWINQHDGTFRNTALLAGAALTQEGKAEASMGVDAGDFDNDGDEDLFITEQTGEGHNLYVNDGVGRVRGSERAIGARAPPASAYTGFGTAWFDYDNDGWLDLLTVNGAVQTIEALAQARDPFPLHQRKQLFRNLGNGRFEDVTARPAPRSSSPRSAAARRSATSTTTATPTSSSPTTTVPCGCCSTTSATGITGSGCGSVAAAELSADWRDMLGARVAIVRKAGPDALAARARRRQLRVGERSARARRPRRFDRNADRSRDVAGWPDGRVAERGHRSLHHARGADDAMTSRRRFLADAARGPARPAVAGRMAGGGAADAPLFVGGAAVGRAGSPGSTTTRCRRRGSSPNRSARAARSSTTTTTGGWTSTSSTAGRRTSTSLPGR